MNTDSSSIVSSLGDGAAGGASVLPLILDIAVLVILLVVAIVGFKKGFLKGLVGLVGTVVAFIIAILCAAPVAEMVENGFGMTTSIANAVEGMLNGMEAFNVPLTDEGLSNALAELGLPGFISDMIIDVVSQLNIEGDPTIAQVVSPVIAGFISTAICGILLFIVSAILLNLFAGLLSKVFDKIPVIGAINHILGLALGLIKGLIFVYIVLGVLSVLPIQGVQDVLAQTTVINWLYEMNLIMLAIENLSVLTPIVEYVQDFISGLTGNTEGTETAAVILASLPC